ncbi:hypothetical protein BI364_14165 [Acidihalobacter yilgarnensis]|uniref:Uncharacterized protein n=1 Tax=Acidihalobacter yilgarnensis TaxID=2819280 RepID=A0A1D8IQX2_9GAMM|nr:hypothetical protein [Acidihalobacter yilgarnensis]AOU98948.1 hypothetical protein BI364_14165 [Acidihalobacter yilgarnensis]
MSVGIKPAASAAGLWPSAEYDRQIARLRAAIGCSIYLIEARLDAPVPSASASGRPHELMGLIDYPRPDPARRLYPHLLLLDDGRGLNLGRVLRVSLDRAYAPSAEQCLFTDAALMQLLLPSERSLSRRLIREVSHVQLGELLGRSTPDRVLEDDST